MLIHALLLLATHCMAHLILRHVLPSLGIGLGVSDDALLAVLLVVLLGIHI